MRKRFAISICVLLVGAARHGVILGSLWAKHAVTLLVEHINHRRTSIEEDGDLLSCATEVEVTHILLVVVVFNVYFLYLIGAFGLGCGLVLCLEKARGIEGIVILI
jgi:hypothetical protein